MPPPVWPLGLPQKVEGDQYTESLGSSVIRTEMDIGLAKVRRRYTKNIENFDMIFLIDSDQYLIFKTFFDVTVNGGATTFTFPHPVTTVPTEVRLLGEPAISHIGAGVFRLSLKVEVIPA
jgi:hypothetical protein